MCLDAKFKRTSVLLVVALAILLVVSLLPLVNVSEETLNRPIKTTRRLSTKDIGDFDAGDDVPDGVEMEEMRTPDSRTYHLGDNSYTTVICLNTTRTRDTQTFQPDNNNGYDTFLSKAYPTYNYGQYSYEDMYYNPYLYVGNDQYTADDTPALGVCRSLVKFDLSSLPGGITSIDSAVVSLYYAGYYGSTGTPIPVEAYKISRSWVEGTGYGTSATAGSGASWNTYDGTNSWSTEGGDYESSILSTVNMPVQETPEPWGFYDWDVTSAAEDWLVNGESNYGILYKYSNEAAMLQQYYVIFLSSEVTGTYAANRPKIMITYSMNSKPVARISGINPNPAYTGDVVSFDATGSSDPEGSSLTYEWNSSQDGPLGSMVTLTIPASDLSIGLHNITLRVQDDVGQWSDPVTTTLEIIYNPPPPDVNAEAYDTPNDNGGSITLAWVQNDEDDFDHYEIYVSISSLSSIDSREPDFEIDEKTSTSKAVTQYGMNKIMDGTPYYFVVVAEDTRGMVSNFSCLGPVQSLDNLAPDPVVIGDAYDTPGDDGGSITLEWTRSTVSDFDRYEIYIDDEQFFNISGMTAEKQITSSDVKMTTLATIGGEELENGADYWVAIVAVDDSGNLITDVGSTVHGPVIPKNDKIPDKLSYVTIQDKMNDQGGVLELTWAESEEEDFLLYAVFVSDSEDGFGMLTLDDAVKTIEDVETTSSDISGTGHKPLDPNTEYYVAVAAVDEANNIGDFEIEGPVIPEDNKAPDMVSGLKIYDTPNDNGVSFTLEWSPSSADDFSLYHVFLSKQPLENFYSLTPSLDISDRETTVLVVEEVEGNAIKAGDEYHAAVTAVDLSGNEDLDNVATAGPVAVVDNIPPSIEGWSHQGEDVLNLTEESSLTLSVTVADEDQGKVQYRWYLDSKQLIGEEGSSVSLDTDDFQIGGDHKVKVEVVQGDMKVSRTWNLSVSKDENNNDPINNNDPDNNKSGGNEQLILMIAIIIAAAVLVLVAVVMKKRKEKALAEAEEKKKAKTKAAPSSGGSFPAYMPASSTNVYGNGPYSMQGSPLYYMDQRYQPDSSAKSEGSGVLDKLASAVKGEEKEEPLPDREKKPTLPSDEKSKLPPGKEEKQALAKLPVKKVPASMAMSLEEAERREKRKKEQKKREKGELCPNQGASVEDYVCPASDMKKCKLECVQKLVFIATKAQALNEGKKVRRCNLQDSSLKAFICPKNVRVRCELECSQKKHKKIKNDYYLCPNCWTKNKLGAEKCKKCGAELWVESDKKKKSKKDKDDKKGKKGKDKDGKGD